VFCSQDGTFNQGKKKGKKGLDMGGAQKKYVSKTSGEKKKGWGEQQGGVACQRA